MRPVKEGVAHIQLQLWGGPALFDMGKSGSVHLYINKAGGRVDDQQDNILVQLAQRCK
jgi:hypothetical protein